MARKPASEANRHVIASIRISRATSGWTRRDIRKVQRRRRARMEVLGARIERDLVGKKSNMAAAVASHLVSRRLKSIPPTLEEPAKK
jgi:hypothetical protein